MTGRIDPDWCSFRCTECSELTRASDCPPYCPVCCTADTMVVS